MVNDHSEYKKVFEVEYRNVRSKLQERENRLMSSWDVVTSLEPYRKIIELGPVVLPFLFEKLREGRFFLNEAAAEITGVNLKEQYPDDIGEQKLAEHWVDWWEHHRTDT